MISVFDVETSFQILEDGTTDPSAKNPNNFLLANLKRLKPPRK